MWQYVVGWAQQISRGSELDEEVVVPDQDDWGEGEGGGHQDGEQCVRGQEEGKQGGQHHDEQHPHERGQQLSQCQHDQAAAVPQEFAQEARVLPKGTGCQKS